MDPKLSYQMHEGYLSLEGDWQDQTSNVLVPQGMDTTGVNLVVSRDIMPMGMMFEDYMRQQKNNFRKELPGLDIEEDSAIEIDGTPARFLEFTWKYQARKLRQVICVMHIEEKILSLTGSIPGGEDEKARESLLNAIKSFKFGLRSNETEST